MLVNEGLLTAVVAGALCDECVKTAIHHDA
jgi:hypothetical protein